MGQLETIVIAVSGALPRPLQLVPATPDTYQANRQRIYRRSQVAPPRGSSCGRGSRSCIQMRTIFSHPRRPRWDRRSTAHAVPRTALAASVKFLSAGEKIMKSKRTLRSAAWFARADKDGFIHRSWMRGYPEDVFDGRPIIGICNTWSELTPCNAHFRDLADRVKRGVWEAGGFPLEFPVTSLGETNARPTAMLFRNLVSMDVEESIRANPMDGGVLLCGCDKTVPALIMGAASCDLPALVVSGGPMLNGKFRGKDIGSGTDVWKFSEDVRAGKLSLNEFMAAESGMSRTPGTCMTMGSASTMACLMEAMGIALPFNASTPAVDAGRRRIAQETGRLIVRLAREDVRLSRVLTRAAFENAIRILGAIGGSTNAVLHLLAFAGRLGLPPQLAD